jgi:hypothetical protein
MTINKNTKMKYNICYNLWSALIVLLSLVACSNQEENLPEMSTEHLQISTVDVAASTRAKITGTVLPNGVQYGIFAGASSNTLNNGKNVAVSYTEGVSTLSNEIVLPQGCKIPVYAYYPYTKGVSATSVPIEILSQTDYLWGWSADTSGDLAYATEASPSVNIHFEHILARVTLRIHKAEDNAKTYHITSAYLNDGGRDFAYRKANANIYEHTLTDFDFGATSGNGLNRGQDILGDLHPDYLKTSKDEIMVDFLVLPSSYIAWSFKIVTDDSELSSDFYGADFQSGMQYTYDVIINQGNKLTLDAEEIVPWTYGIVLM